jgi:hypothetical protein
MLLSAVVLLELGERTSGVCCSGDSVATTVGTLIKRNIPRLEGIATGRSERSHLLYYVWSTAALDMSFVIADRHWTWSHSQKSLYALTLLPIVWACYIHIYVHRNGLQLPSLSTGESWLQKRCSSFYVHKHLRQKWNLTTANTPFENKTKEIQRKEVIIYLLSSKEGKREREILEW